MSEEMKPSCDTSCNSCGPCGKRRGHCGKGALGLLALVAAVYLGILAHNAWKASDFIGRPTPQRDTIAISGEGKVTAIPDIATVSIGVQTEKPKVGDAQTENTTKMNAIIDKIKSFGVADADIQTSNYSIYPQYDYTNNVQALRGYQVSQSVDVKIRKLDSIGDILTAAGTLGANNVGGVNFTIDQPEKIQDQARLKALEAAKSKAQALAAAAGVQLGKIVSFSESVSGGYQPPIMYAKDMAMGAGIAAAPAPSIQTGSQDVIVDVTVNYELL
jgi:hypothetical protein